MKQFILILLLLLGITNIYAQNPGDREDRIQAVKIAYITEEINLTSRQSQQFWPLYNEYQAAIKSLNQSLRKNIRLKDMSDAEISAFIENKLTAEEQKIALQRTYLQKYLQVISIRQIARLYRAEQKFKKELLRRAKERRESRGNGARNR